MSAAISLPSPRAGRGAAPSLATLRKLATYADTPEAAPDLRAHVLAHLATYAPLFGVATARLAASISEAPDATLASMTRGSIAIVLTRAREAKEGATALERDAAAARVSASLQFAPASPDGPGYALDASAVLECTEGASGGKDPFVRFLPRDGNGADIAARPLRAILKLKPDARVALVGGRIPTLVVRWGTVGRMRLVSQLGRNHDWPLTAISLPAVARLDGGPADVVQGCPFPPSPLGAVTKDESLAFYARFRAHEATDYARSERARLNDDQTFRIAPLPEPPPAPPPPAPRKGKGRPVLSGPPMTFTVPPVAVDAFERAAASRVIHVGPYPMTPPAPLPSRPAAGPTLSKAACAAPPSPPPSPEAPGGKAKRRGGPPPPSLSPAIYTYGYAGRAPAELAALARQLGAGVIDVRGIPQSRHSGWRRGALESLLGARYQWRGTTLGNKGEHRTTEAGLASLANLTRPAILLCGCGTPGECHRHRLIARPLAKRGIRVRHVYPAALDEPGAAGLRVVDAAELQRAIDEGDSYDCHDLADVMAELRA